MEIKEFTRKYKFIILFAIFSIVILGVVASIILLPWGKTGEKLYVKRATIIVDTAGVSHFLGINNEIILEKGSVLIHRDDTLEIGDSVVDILYEKQLVDNSGNLDESFSLIQDSDTVIVAELQSDMKLTNEVYNIPLYARKGERFLVKEQKDSLRLLYDDKEYAADKSKLKFDTILKAKYNDIPFVIEYFIQANDSNSFVLMVCSDQKETGKSKLPYAVYIYAVYQDSLLCKVEKTQENYEIRLSNNINNEDIKFRIAFKDHISSSIQAQQAEVIKIEKGSLEHTWNPIGRMLMILLCLVVIVSLVCLFIFFKRGKNQVVDESTEEENDEENESEEVRDKEKEIARENDEINELKDKIYQYEIELSCYEKELSRLKKVEENKEEEINKAKEKANKKADEEIKRARESVDRAKERAEKAEEQSKKIRQEVTNQFTSEIEEKNKRIKEKQEVIDNTQKKLNQTEKELRSKEQECNYLTGELNNKIEALKAYSSRITDVQPAGVYAKSIAKLIEIGSNIELAADKLLEKVTDDYLLNKYIVRYHKAIHQIDMSQFSTDILNIANVQFVYSQQPLAKYNQRDEKQFKESMKIFFFESYLSKYINALVVFNETMAGLHHIVTGINENDTIIFVKYRDELEEIFEELEIKVDSVKIFDAIIDNVDLRVDMRPLDFDCPSGTICQIDSCLVYLKGGNKPNDKIHVIVKE